MNPPTHGRAVGLLVLAALAWSLGGVLIKAADWPPLAVAGGRGLVATVFLLAVRGRRLRFTWSPIQLGAAVSYAGCTVLFAAANKLTTAANAILLQYTAPVWVALLGAWFLRERVRAIDWIAIVAVLGGMSAFLYDGLRVHDLAGNIVAAASGVCFAAMVVLLRGQKDGSPLESIVLGNFLGFLIGLPAMIGAGLPSGRTSGMLLLLGVVQLGVPYLLYARAIRTVSALEAVLIPVVEPILNPVWVMLAFGERPTGIALAGGLVVIGSVLIRAISSIRRSSAIGPPAAV
ncbi:MAG TPA: EamA family transporter [Candidatus Didemnitutus sp.]|nr:EamA family transporter [Candidatus Didemnitutus sp.]